MRTDFLFRFRYQWLVGVLLLVAVVASPVFAAGNEKTPASPQSTFEARCALCHGVGGRGDGWQSKVAFWMKTPNFTDAAYMQTRSDDALFQMIKAGGQTGMPSYKLEFNDAQIKELVAYVRGFTRTAGSPKPAGAPR